MAGPLTRDGLSVDQCIKNPGLADTVLCQGKYFFLSFLRTLLDPRTNFFLIARYEVERT